LAILTVIEVLLIGIIEGIVLAVVFSLIVFIQQAYIPTVCIEHDALRDFKEGNPLREWCSIYVSGMNERVGWIE
jgi:hypothetical protein